ncbi:protein YIF1B-B [Epargyreus clarus]|uniref:protein YIF1B-B n=1 Tax=Epargyreus clarus TaxID=520877 RepID=UPI003C2AB0D2
MNFNASRNVGHAGGPRKAKRVSDVAAMGAPSSSPGFSPAPAFSPGYPPAGPPPPYQQGIQLDPGQDFGAQDTAAVPGYGFGGGFSQSPMASPAQLGAMLQQPIVQDMALQYGNELASRGGAAVRRELGRVLPVSRLRYYFAVDTRYVLRKLMLILFPYRHKDWVVKYDQDTPVQPRYDINAPDLYIPSMGYVTYVLLAGFMLGLQHRFSPEQIGIQASSALAYIIFEMLLYLVTLYITNTSTALTTLDLLAHSGYKYITMICSLLAGLLLGRTGYYSCLLYCSLALSYFLVQTLRLQLLSGGSQTQEPPSYAAGAAPPGYAGGYGGSYAGSYGDGNPYASGWARPAGTKRRLYFLLFVAFAQPLLSWWLTYHLVPSAAAAAPATPAPAR